MSDISAFLDKYRSHGPSLSAAEMPAYVDTTMHDVPDGTPMKTVLPLGAAIAWGTGPLPAIQERHIPVTETDTFHANPDPIARACAILAIPNLNPTKYRETKHPRDAQGKWTTVYHGTSIGNVPAVAEWARSGGIAHRIFNDKLIALDTKAPLYVTDTPERAARYASTQSSGTVESEPRLLPGAAVLHLEAPGNVRMRRRPESHGTLDTSEATISSARLRKVVYKKPAYENDAGYKRLLKYLDEHPEIEREIQNPVIQNPAPEDATQAQIREEWRAHKAVARAIEAGKLTRPGTHNRRSPKYMEAHHPNYAQPLNVRWETKEEHVGMEHRYNPLPLLAFGTSEYAPIIAGVGAGVGSAEIERHLHEDEHDNPKRSRLPFFGKRITERRYFRAVERADKDRKKLIDRANRDYERVANRTRSTLTGYRQESPARIKSARRLYDIKRNRIEREYSKALERAAKVYENPLPFFGHRRPSLEPSRVDELREAHIQCVKEGQAIRRIADAEMRALKRTMKLDLKDLNERCRNQQREIRESSRTGVPAARRTSRSRLNGREQLEAMFGPPPRRNPHLGIDGKPLATVEAHGRPHDVIGTIDSIEYTNGSGDYIHEAGDKGVPFMRGPKSKLVADAKTGAVEVLGPMRFRSGVGLYG